MNLYGARNNLFNFEGNLHFETNKEKLFENYSKLIKTKTFIKMPQNGYYNIQKCSNKRYSNCKDGGKKVKT